MFVGTVQAWQIGIPTVSLGRTSRGSCSGARFHGDRRAYAARDVVAKRSPFSRIDCVEGDGHVGARRLRKCGSVPEPPRRRLKARCSEKSSRNVQLNGPLSVALSNGDVPRFLAPRLLEDLLASLACAFERQTLSDAGGWTKRALRSEREIGEGWNDMLRLRDDGRLHERHRSADHPPPPPPPEGCHSCLGRV